MYREKDSSSFNWLKIFLRVIIAFLILLLSVKLVSIIIDNHDNKKTETNLQNNLKKLDEVAKKYFTDDLPEHAGDMVKVYVSHLINTKAIEELKDEKGNACDYDKSFIQITRLDSEYQIKSYLECSGNNDYLNSFVNIDNNSVTIKPKTTTKKVKTTKKKKTTTTKKKTTTTKTTATKTTNANFYKVNFNTNGGNQIPTQTIKKGSIITYVEPKRDGYKFIGWYHAGKKFDRYTKINGNYVLVAKWIKA